MISPVFKFIEMATGLMISKICAASSRVGVKISARMLLGSADFPRSCCKIGSANAAVLPVPVCADAKTSLPTMIAGMAAAWIEWPAYNLTFERRPEWFD